MNAWRERLLRAAYSLAMGAVVPLYLLRVRWRGRKEPIYASVIGERLAIYSKPADRGAFWIHAVSLGETRAAAPLIDALRREFPGQRLLLTHGTATGREAGRPLLQAGDAQAWLPFDTAGAARRFLDHFSPLAGVLMETEIWPNVLAEARTRALPMFLANARMSERSRRRGRRIDGLLRPAFGSLAAVFAQSQSDAVRLRDAGASEVSVQGNLKYDLMPEPRLIALGKRWKASAAARPVVLGAVMREGEEAMLLGAWRGLAVPRPLLVVVPRHPQRFEAVAALIDGSGFSLARRSRWGELPPAAADIDVWLGDSMHEMAAYYALADVALLGGSFAALGGQNLIEASACACPIVMGPHTFNFADAAALAIEAGAAVRVCDIGEGVARAVAMAHSGEQAQRASAATGFAAAHRGAAARTAARVAAVLRARDA